MHGCRRVVIEIYALHLGKTRPGIVAPRLDSGNKRPRQQFRAADILRRRWVLVAWPWFDRCDQTRGTENLTMWKRDDGVKPTSDVPSSNQSPQASMPATPQPGPRPQSGRDTVNIGKSVVIKGELTGSEDLTIEGQVEGKIELKDNVLTIGANGKIKAQVFAKALIVLGEVTGNVTASDKVEIRDGGSVDGDIVSPRVAIAEGAHFRGSVDMQRKAIPPPQPAKPTQPAAPVAASSPQPAGR